jgi:hypothetical protein
MKPINEGANPLMEPVEAGMFAPSPNAEIKGLAGSFASPA